VATPAPVDEPPVTSAGEPAAKGRQIEAVHLFQQAFAQAKTPPRWPMYARQVKQLVKGVEPQFDERALGFNGIIDALRFGQREGLFRLERDRLGVVRIFPGPALQVRQPGGGEPTPPDRAPADGPGEFRQPDLVEQQDEVTMPAAADAGGVMDAATGAADSRDGAPTTGDDAAVPPEGGAGAGTTAEAGGPETPAAPQQGRRRSRAATGAQPRARKATGTRRTAAGATAPRRGKGRKPGD
jgi:hypothetical protein